MIKVSNEVEVLEIDGKMVEKQYCIKILSDYNKNKIIIEKDGSKITVLAKDLLAAIQNATNNGR